MDKSQAVQLLIQAVTLAQTKGAFSFEDSAKILQAIQVINSPSQPVTPPTKEDIEKAMQEATVEVVRERPNTSTSNTN